MRMARTADNGRHHWGKQWRTHDAMSDDGNIFAEAAVIKTKTRTIALNTSTIESWNSLVTAGRHRHLHPGLIAESHTGPDTLGLTSADAGSAGPYVVRRAAIAEDTSVRVEP
jgi:hypothetical protein